MFRQIEAEGAAFTERMIEFGRDTFDALSEAMFLGIYGWLAPFVPRPEPTATTANAALRPPPEEVMPIEVTALCYQGGYTEATTRMLLLLAHARGLLFPTQVNEAFGLVMAEALMSGTPVIASSHGSCPDIVSQEVGFVCQDDADYVRAIERIGEISPRACRERAIANYHYLGMTLDYIREYEAEMVGVARLVSARPMVCDAVRN